MLEPTLVGAYTPTPNAAGIAMDASDPHIENAMERLHAEIGALRERLAESARDVEARSQGMLLAETPIADHELRLARERHERIRIRLGELEAELGALILDRESNRSTGTRRAG
ncbi:MAG: hypothetical protein ABR600_09080 [Actinomycetota bacterium]